MIHTIKAQLQVLENYTEVALDTGNIKLIKDLYYYIGYLKGMMDGGTNDFDKVDEYTRDDIYNTYQELCHYEHQQSPAGGNE